MDSYLSYLLLILTGFYLLITILLQIGLTRKWKLNDHQPAVSILVAARNEAHVLAACLESLVNQSYPKDMYEIIILNDRSEDQTGDIAAGFCKKHDNVYCHTISEDRHGLAGKMNVLHQGIMLTENPVIMVTDADCRVPVNWVSSLISYLGEGTGMVAGLTRLSPSQSIWQKLLASDWLYLQAIASGSAGFGQPVSLLGNNFAFRREIYEQTGGFPAIGFSLTEDMALLNAMRQKTHWRLAYPLKPDTEISSLPVNSVTDLISQRVRWAKSGRNASLWGKLMMIVSAMAHWFLLFAVITTINFEFILLALTFIFLADLSLYARVRGRLKRWQMVWFFPVYKLFHFLYILFFTVRILIPLPVEWKGRKYP